MSASVIVQIKALIVIHSWEILCTSTDTLHMLVFSGRSIVTC